MACNSPQIGRIVIEEGTDAPNAVLWYADQNSPALFVSNAPEQIGPGGGGLWPFGDGPWNLCRTVAWSPLLAPLKIRVFFWHISRFDVPTYWAIRAYGAGTVTNRRIQVFNDHETNLSIPGRCLADAQLFGSLDAMQGSVAISPEASIVEFEVPACPGTPEDFQLIAFVLEFTVSGLGPVYLRSAVSLNPGQFRTYLTPLAPAQNNWVPPGQIVPATHVRGYWPHSDLHLTLPGVFDCSLNTPPPWYDWVFCDQDGAELAYFSRVNSTAEDSQDNPGAYGANLNYYAAYANPDSQPRNLRVGIRSRNIPAKYFGAGRILAANLYSLARQLPPIEAAEDPTLKGYDLNSVYPEPNPIGHITVPANTLLDAVRIMIANGGGCGTPANIILNKAAVWPVPNQ